MPSGSEPAGGAVGVTGPISSRYAGWVLALLTLSYTSSYMDRAILSIVQQPIKQEMHLSDTQLGLLGGFAFALFYSLLGLPVARLAERRSRVAIISTALVLWSLATSLCGVARGYPALFALRMAVGIGEAGAGPPAQSLITDYVRPAWRSFAFAIYSLGIAFGVLVGSIAGGYIAQRYGWRMAFVAFGVPGILLAAAIAATIREPLRGGMDGLAGTATDAPTMRTIFRHIRRRPALLHLTAGASLAAFGGYSINVFCAAFLIRNFGITLASAGVMLGIICGASAGIGTLIGGIVTTRLTARDLRWQMWVPAVGLAAATPVYIAGFLATPLALSVGLLVLAPILHFVYIGPTFAAIHGMAEPRMRATVAALYYLVVNIIGLGVGPTLTGAASDMIAARAFHRLMPHDPFAVACRVGTVRSGPMEAACTHASAFGVRVALALAAATLLWAAVHYVLGARHLKRDLIG